MFKATLFTTAKTQKQPKCPTKDEWIKKLWYIYDGILLSQKKEHIWVSSKEVDKPQSLSYRVKQVRYMEIQKDSTDDRAAKEKQTYKTDYGHGGRGGGRR